jgi:hypothetical protein
MYFFVDHKTSIRQNVYILFFHWNWLRINRNTKKSVRWRHPNLKTGFNSRHGKVCVLCHLKPTTILSNGHREWALLSGCYNWQTVEVTTYASLVQIKNVWSLTSIILVFVRWCLDMLTAAQLSGVVKTHNSLLLCRTSNDADSRLYCVVPNVKTAWWREWRGKWSWPDFKQ